MGAAILAAIQANRVDPYMFEPQLPEGLHIHVLVLKRSVTVPDFYLPHRNPGHPEINF